MLCVCSILQYMLFSLCVQQSGRRRPRAPWDHMADPMAAQQYQEEVNMLTTTSPVSAWFVSPCRVSVSGPSTGKRTSSVMVETLHGRSTSSAWNLHLNLHGLNCAEHRWCKSNMSPLGGEPTQPRCHWASACFCGWASGCGPAGSCSSPCCGAAQHTLLDYWQEQEDPANDWWVHPNPSPT